jgi:hypothetical protein
MQQHKGMGTFGRHLVHESTTIMDRLILLQKGLMEVITSSLAFFFIVFI